MFDDLFKALSDPTRRSILKMLRRGDMTAGEIAKQFDITKPSMSHHLNVLKQAGLVLSDRNGQHIYYSLNTTVLQDVMVWLMKFTQNQERDDESGEQRKK
ncbi:MAG: autorepressor SdpR family transcription factor [Firmicutes bacterium]|nr:autorepressor SdpR family transcription factor [Bacillota bacterium]